MPPPPLAAVQAAEGPLLPWGSITLVAASMLVFLLGVLFPIGYPESLTEKLMLFTDGPVVHQFVTYGFVHYTWVHAFFDIAMLALLAPALERRIGFLALLVLHFAACLVVAAVYLIWIWTFTDLPPAAGGTLPCSVILGAMLMYLSYPEEHPLHLGIRGVGEIEWNSVTASAIGSIYLAFNLSQPLLRHNKVFGYEDFGWFVFATHLIAVATGAAIVAFTHSRRIVPRSPDAPLDLSTSVYPGGSSSSSSTSSTFAPLAGSMPPETVAGTSAPRRRVRVTEDISAIMQAIDACDVNQAFASYKAMFVAARREGDKAARLDADYQWRLAQLLLSEYREREAMVVLKALIEHHPGSGPYHQAQYELGLLYANSPDTRRDAIQSLTKALEGELALDRNPDTANRRPLSLQAREHAAHLIAKLGEDERKAEALLGETPVPAAETPVPSATTLQQQIWEEMEQERKRVPVAPREAPATDLDSPLRMDDTHDPLLDAPALAVSPEPVPPPPPVSDLPRMAPPPVTIPAFIPPPTVRSVASDDLEYLDEPLPQPVPIPSAPAAAPKPAGAPARPMNLGDLKKPAPHVVQEALPAPPAADPDLDTASPPSPGSETPVPQSTGIPIARRPLYRSESTFAVILSPGSPVLADPVADLLPKFLRISASAALHAVKSRHGILATDLVLEEAERLATALSSAGQGVYLVEQDDRTRFGDPVDVLRMTLKEQTIGFHTMERPVTRNWSDLIAIGCGSVHLSATGTGRPVIDLHFQEPGLHVRIWRSTLMAAPPYFSGRRDGGEEFQALGRAIQAAAPPSAIRATCFADWLAAATPAIGEEFQSLIEYDSYVMWYLMAYHSRAKAYNPPGRRA